LRRSATSHDAAMTKTHLYAAILASSPVVELAGTAVQLPTHANLIWRAVVLLAAMLLLRLQVRVLERLLIRMVLPTLYVVVFIGVSYFGVAPEYSIHFRVLWLPLLLFDFIAWYLVAYFVDEKVFFKYLAIGTCVFGFFSVALAQADFLVLGRVISGPDVSMAVAPAVMLQSTWLVGALMLFSVASLKKTVVACSLAAAAYAYMRKWIKGERYPQEQIGIDPLLRIVLASVLTISLIGIMLASYLPLIQMTMTRIFNDEEDVLRLAAVAEFVRLTGEFFPAGTGYYTFPYLTQDTIPYTSETLSGAVYHGMPLHNTYMHYALEGGALITLIIGVMHVQYIVTMSRLRDYSRPLVNVLVSWLLISFIFGMLQQWHAYRYFFGMFGFALGALDRYRHRT
jgi:hypothetical protein